MKLTQKDLKDVKSNSDDVSKLKRDVQGLNYTMIGIIVVFFVAFLGLNIALVSILTDGFRSREMSFSDLSKTILEQKILIDQQQKDIDKLGEETSVLYRNLNQIYKFK